MSCGCGTKKKYVKEQGDRIPTAAALCHVCPRAEHDPVNAWVRGAVVCSIDGVPVLNHVMLSSCPLGKHPDGSGITRWLGIRWFGLPYPLRVILWAFHPKHRPVSWWKACGCSVVGLRAWNYVKKRVSSFVQRGHSLPQMEQLQKA